MAVELEVCLSRPFNAEIIRSNIENVLKQRLCLSEKPHVELRFQKLQSESVQLPEHHDMIFSIGELAKVSVMLYSSPSDSIEWACISYAPLRSPESKMLCLATAVAVAKHNGGFIEDECSLFRHGILIDPDHAFDGIDDLGNSHDFTTQATKATQLLDLRPSPNPTLDSPPCPPHEWGS